MEIGPDRKEAVRAMPGVFSLLQEQILRSGGLVGIPTETVYGLGANGLNPEAVRAIFKAKGRPQDNPLILHIPEASWLERYCENIPPQAWALAQRFWPGPMTMILPRKALVPDEVTAGLETVGEARSLVEYAKFAPLGKRGYCPTRDGGWGMAESCGSSRHSSQPGYAARRT